MSHEMPPVFDEPELRARGSLKWTEFPGEIGAFIAEMDFGIAPPVRLALEAAIGGAMTSYLPSPVAARHAEATAAWMRERYDWSIEPEQVHHVADVIACLELALTRFSRPGTPVIVPTPAYMPFLELPRELGREVIELPMAQRAGRWVIDPDRLDQVFADGGAGGLLILCNPANPTGTVFTRDELLAIAGAVERHGARVFADEVHAPLILQPGLRHVPYASVSDAAAAHTVTGTSAAKAWNIAGLKCGQFIVSNDADEALWQRECVRAENGASVLGVIANTAAYTSGARWLGGVLEQLRSNRDRLAELVAEKLPEVRFTVPEGTYFLWMDCGELRLPGGPADFFHKRAQVALTGGAACGQGFAESVRFNFAMPPAVLERAVERMAQAVSAA